MKFVYRRRAVRPSNPTLDAQKELAELRRKFEAKRIARKERYTDALVKAREEHEREFSRPLIDRKLLTDEERWQHRFMVKGVQRWAPMGGWRGQ